MAPKMEVTQSNIDISQSFGLRKRSNTEQVSILIFFIEKNDIKLDRVIKTMDISNLFWDFIDYELNFKHIINAVDDKLFERIRQGDVIMNMRNLNEDEDVEFLYYDNISELISTANSICTGEKLKKIQKYIDLYFEDMELSEMFQVEM